MIGTAERGPDRDTPRVVDPAQHYLRTFEHLRPGDPQAGRQRRRRPWVGVAIAALLALTFVRWPGGGSPGPEPERRASAPKQPAPEIALAPAEPQLPSVAPEPPRVVERQGPKLIERLLAEKLGTMPPTRAEAPKADAPSPAKPAEAAPMPKPVVTDRPALAEKRAAERATQLAAAEAERTAKKQAEERRREEAKRAEVARAESARAEEAKRAETQRQRAEAARAEAQRAETKRVEDGRAEAERTTVARAEPATPTPVRERPVAAERVIERPTERVVAERATPAVREQLVSAPTAAFVATRAEPVPPPVERVAARAPVRTSGPTADAVRLLLERYAAAWRGHDVDTLRAIGQVTSEGQANALREYFASIGELEVEVRVLDIRTEGDRATVRFTRRDRFRDPTGREIAKESPPIEKVVVSTPQGLRFGPSS